jgi:VIT1/CCC1 family predicted Fe2+/Mn2+ transporter
MSNVRSIDTGPRGDHQQRGLRDLVHEILDELKEFAATRLQVVKAELQETMSSVKVAVPLSLVALIFLFSGFLLFTAAAVAIVARAFAASPYAWFLSFVIVGFVWTAAGAIAAYFAYSEFRAKGRFPKTVEVLKADRAWLRSEARG